MRAVFAILLLALACSSAAGARSAPVVRVASATPLTVVGTSFAPRERLRLVVHHDGLRKVRSFRATVTGRFTARFAAEAVEDRCSIAASVTRASGRTIVAKLPAPLCPQPARP
jgi:hypothetical protein